MSRAYYSTVQNKVIDSYVLKFSLMDLSKEGGDYHGIQQTESESKRRRYILICHIRIVNAILGKAIVVCTFFLIYLVQGKKYINSVNFITNYAQRRTDNDVQKVLLYSDGCVLVAQCIGLRRKWER